MADLNSGEVDYLRGFVNRLRLKLQDDSSNPRYIRMETGVGSRFIVEQILKPALTHVPLRRVVRHHVRPDRRL